VRRARPDQGEIDFWVVDHGHGEGVAKLLLGSPLGHPVALWGPRRGFRPRADAARWLIAVDETGFAALATMLALAGEVQVIVVAETVAEDHIPPLEFPPETDVVWVWRGTDTPGRTNRLLAAVQHLDLQREGLLVFGAGESRQISAVRAHFRTVIGLPAADVSMTGYWRAP
jgi:NADPH-dependent ferric siderophore reductase